MSSIALNAIVQICSRCSLTSCQRLPCSKSARAREAASLFLHSLPPISFSSSLKMLLKCWSTALLESFTNMRQMLVMPSLMRGFGSKRYLQAKCHSACLQRVQLTNIPVLSYVEGCLSRQRLSMDKAIKTSSSFVLFWQDVCDLRRERACRAWV